MTFWDNLVVVKMAGINICVYLLLTFGCLTCASGCTWMKTQNKETLSNFQVLSNSSISHLQQACKNSVRDHGNLGFEFPNKQYNHVRQLQAKDHILFILRTLKNVMRLYSENYEKSNCDQQKLQIFLLDIDRQISELERCASKIVATEVNLRISKKMEIHFKSMISHLKNTDYSANGWDGIARLVLKHLRRLDLLSTETKNDSSE